jgi:2-succinyl-5-enolpyruvyl-6-hydroxy-3-cyclohexene-1-carboxylate synthase
MNREDVNALWADVFVDELARGGVSELCVAPGSRATPLILAAVRDGRFRMFSIVDERSAGYFALGVGKASGRPAAVITTSGTAAANLYPAVIEASQGEVPLLVVTADRPHWLRDADGNQAIDQLRLFGTFPRGFFEIEPARREDRSLRHLRALAGRAIALAKGPPMGPVHLNFPFEKPLEPSANGASPRGTLSGPGGTATRGAVGEGGVSVSGRAAQEPQVRTVPPYSTVTEEEVLRLREILAGSPRGVIVAGPVPNPREVGPAVLALAAATGFPVLADPLSGTRFAPSLGAQVVAGYDLFLRSGPARAALAPDLILRVGSSPTSAGVLAYLEEHGEAKQVVVDEGHRWKDHLSRAHDYIQAAPGPLLERLAREAPWMGEKDWTGLWGDAEARTRAVLERRTSKELLEGEILAAVVEVLPEAANLLVSSSMPIRDLDAFGRPGAETLNVFGNRGASGIDGLVSTTLGIAAAARGTAPTVGVLGDLAFMHDMNGLLALKDLKLWTIFVVVNNDGGGIFHTLPVRDHEPAFSRFFATPHGLDFRKTAELYQLPYESAASIADFRRAFVKALGEGGPAIVEVQTNREATHAERERVVSAVVEAVDDLAHF